MKKIKFIPYSKNKAIIKTLKDTKLVELKELDTKFYEDIPITEEPITRSEIISYLSEVSNLQEGITSLLEGMDGFLTSYLNYYLVDEEDKKELKKVFRILDYIKDEVEKANIITSTLNMQIIRQGK
jgi:hypothetical protein